MKGAGVTSGEAKVLTRADFGFFQGPEFGQILGRDELLSGPLFRQTRESDVR